MRALGADPRRRIVVGIAVLVGAPLLGFSLHQPAGSRWFVPSALALAVWWAVAARVSGPIPLGNRGLPAGRAAWARAVVPPLLLGVALVVVFVVGAFVVALLPFLREPVRALLAHSSGGSVPLVLLVTVLNGIGEELFFRGALYDALPGHAVVVSTVVYACVTAFSGIPLLVLAAVILGLLTAVQRRVSGGIGAPVITHLVWSVGMLFLLPLVL